MSGLETLRPLTQHKFFIMKEPKIFTLLVFMALIFSGSLSYGQCTPDTTRTWTGNSPSALKTGCVGEMYSDTMYFSFPRDTVVIVPVSLDSYEVSSITRPAWMSYGCNTGSCKWTDYNTQLTADHLFACIVVSGVPDAAYTGDIGAMIIGHASTFLGYQADSALSPFPIVINDAPVSGFTESIVGETATFTDGSSGAASYLWDFGDGNTDSTASPVHTYASSGMYTVCQTVTSSGCSDSTCSILNIVVVGRPGEGELAGMEVFPNPSSGTMTLRGSAGFASEVNIRVLNLSGMEVYSSSSDILSHRFEVSLDLQELPAGMYLIDVQAGDNRALKKIIIQN